MTDPPRAERALIRRRGAAARGARGGPASGGSVTVVVVGDLAVDVLVAPLVPPVPGADSPARITTAAGGAGANTAAWLAALGAVVTLVARVGDDPAGAAAVAELAVAGVTAAVAVDPSAPTATVVVLHDRAGRTMLSDRGAAAHLSPADLPAPLARRGDHVHLSGYVLHDPGSRQAGLAALAAARAAGASTSVDPQATGVLTAALLRELGGVDLLLPNADELAALTGSPDPRSAADLLDAVGAVAVTHGAGGATWVDRSGVRTATAPPARVVDPTGAGDAFDAGLIAARLAGAGPCDALAAGCRAGAAAVSLRGARPAASPRPRSR